MLWNGWTPLSQLHPPKHQWCLNQTINAWIPWYLVHTIHHQCFLWQFHSMVCKDPSTKWEVFHSKCKSSTMWASAIICETPHVQTTLQCHVLHCYHLSHSKWSSGTPLHCYAWDKYQVVQVDAIAAHHTKGGPRVCPSD